MDVIPVIDLLGGEVVHARQGDRARYRPIRSALCDGSAPLDVVGALLDLHPFDSLYVADLDAIQARGNNGAALERIASAHPGLRLWVDNGLHDAAAGHAWLQRGLGRLVLGSEAQDGMETLDALRNAAPPGRLILSLDFRGDDFLGPPELLSDPDRWPDAVIVMTLGRVGSDRGPDLARLDDIRARAGARQVYAAGGVRDAGDLARLAAAGAAGVLVASALHDRRIGRDALAAARA